METQKPRRRWFRFRLRTLLVMVTLVSVPLGWAGWELDQRRREKPAIAWVVEMGGEVHFYSPTNDIRSWWEQTTDNLLGERVRMVDLDLSPVSDLSPLAELKHLKGLFLQDTQVSNLSPLAELKNLERLAVSATKVSDLSPLAELKNLKGLYFSSCTKVNDLSSLADLKKLESLFLYDTSVSEEQIEELRLALPDCKIEF